MSTSEPDSGYYDPVADRPGEDWDAWDTTDEWGTAAPTSGRPVEVEVVPSRWPDPADTAAPASRRRWWTLAAAAAAVITVTTVWLLLTSTPDEPSVVITPATPSAAPETPAPPTETDTEVPVPTANTPVPTGEPATGRAADVAGGFATDYANTVGGKDDWLTRISRWTAPELADGYRLTDPNRLPTARFQRLSPPLNNDSGTVIYDALYDTMTLEIRIAFLDDRWQVIAALDTHPLQYDVSPPGSTPPQTTPYLPPDIGTPHP